MYITREIEINWTEGGLTMKRHDISFTKTEDRWQGDIHTTDGWIARWRYGDWHGALWRRTKSAAYTAARRMCIQAEDDHGPHRR